MMTKGMELKNDYLMMVCGGDYGDAEQDNGNLSRYHEGDIVEVYSDFFHVCTHKANINMSDFYDGHWNYYVTYYYADAIVNAKNPVTADDIQRKFR